ncbi:thioredoxin family protein [Microvirga arabica]|uniref:thioredoxin family protein n=1 Tax=Microvirga arabica TaxID=1128671 RepID=UPI00193A4C69|nr:thioredoxin family protein [Microvirga arabica]MBM1172126.1 thioredoxin family protein [Microvirga arabica]
MAVSSSRSRASARADACSRRTILTYAALLPGLALVPQSVQAQAAELAFAHVTTREAFDAAVRRARAQKKPMLAYFTAEWCSICKGIDARVFSNPVIRTRLEDIALVRADVTAADAGNRALMEHLRVPGPPTMFVVDPKDGREMPGTRLVGSIDANLFLDTINLAGL